MPIKKTYPPASRRSHRLAPEETPVSEAENAENETLRRIEEEQNIVPSREERSTENEGSMSNAENAAAAQADRIQQLEVTIARLEATIQSNRHATPAAPRPVAEDIEDRSRREITPAESAFGGTAFNPTGQAALPAFKRFGTIDNDRNPNYSDKAKSRGKEPQIFEGDEKVFDRWVRSLAAKFEEDDATFRSEKSRVNYMMELVKGGPAEALEPRYLSTENPFSGVAEMIQVLEAVYHDRNQSSAARLELSTMMFDPNGDSNIHRFISKINSLAQKAHIASADMKQTLWEHIPKYLDHSLLDLCQDPSISYESFCTRVSNRAYSLQVSRGERQASQKDYGRWGNQKPGKASVASRKQTQPIKPTTSAAAGRGLTEDEKKAHWDAGTCFNCGKTGHMSRDCPDKTKISAVGAKNYVDKDVRVEIPSAEETGNE